MNRPLLFLDVDGPLIPFGGAGYPTYPPEDENPLLARVDPGHGRRLAALCCDLVWATTWGADANECLSPRLGLASLPLVDWPEEPEEQDGLHWKTRAIVGWAADRPFVWVDDEITDADRAWVRAHHPAPALLHRVDPVLGLGDDDYAAIAAWLQVLHLGDEFAQ